MTVEMQRTAVAALGFTPRQAGFLVHVLRHSGVCLPRQYCAFANIARGQKTHDFFSRLVARRFATPYVAVNGRTRVYHLQNKRLYRTIGDAETRLRRRQSLDRATERLMLLDHVLGEPAVHWMSGEREKVEYFTSTTSLRPGELPSLTFGQAHATTVRYFPDRLPIGVSTDLIRHVFLFVVTQDVPLDFRTFLHRHGEVLRALREWEIRLIAAAPLAAWGRAYEEAFLDEATRPLAPRLVDELAWYFSQLRAQAPSDAGRFRAARRQFGAPRFRGLYRSWRVSGDAVVHAAASRALADAVARGSGRLVCAEPAHRYERLSPLGGPAAAATGGTKGGTWAEAARSPQDRVQEDAPSSPARSW